MQLESKIRQMLQRRGGSLAAFGIAFILMAIHAWMNRDLPIRGDAYEIWKVAEGLWRDSPAPPARSFVEYRGFVVFAASALIGKLASTISVDAIWLLRLFLALMFAGLSVVSLPSLLGRLAGVQPRVWHRLTTVVVVFVFFRGHFLYPSNDIPAVWFLLLALNSALRGGTCTVKDAVLAGAFLGLAILCRSNYVVAIPMVLLLAWRLGDGFTGSRKGLGLAGCMVLAFLTTFAMDRVYQQYRDSTAGPMVFNGKPYGGRKVLLAQLTMGLKVQRVEWYTGPVNPGTLLFEERTGKELLAREQRSEGWLQLGEWFSLLFRNPAAFTGIFARHAFNGVDLAYPMVYVPDVTRRSWLFSLVNLFLIAAGIVTLVMRLAKGRDRLLPFVIASAMALPALSCMPFPVEPRFFASLSLLLLPLAPYGLSAVRARGVLKPTQALVVAVACLTLTLVGVMFSKHVFSTLESGARVDFHTFP